MKDISQPVEKVDAKDKISGRMKYVSDYKMDGMLYAKTVRSTMSHAKIKQITLPDVPEGYFIVDYKDIPGKNYVKMIFEDWPVFAEDIVNYIGEPIMLVVGEDKAIIQSIVNAIKIDYEVLKPRFDYTKSEVNYHYKKGKPKSVFEKYDNHIEFTYTTGYQEQAYIEPQGFIAYPEAHRIVLEGSIQAPYYVKNAVITTMDCDPDDIRVKQTTVGGAFGGKEEFPSMIGCQLAVAVNKIKKPIKLIYEREEDMEVTTKRHPSKIIMTAAIDEQNRVAGLHARVALDGGAYIGLSGVVLSRAMIAATNAYTINHLDIEGDVYRTNTVPNGAFRGFGAPQMIFAIEMFMHHIAYTLKIDPFEFRMNHLVKQGDLTSTSGEFRDPIMMPEMIKLACEMSNYHEKAKTYQDKGVRKGIGMSWFFHGCGFTGSGEAKHINAKVKLKKDEEDTVHILIAAVDMGQGAKTTLMKVVASVLDIPLSQVRYENPDTDEVPDSGPTVASRTAMVVGGLLARAAKTLKEQWQEGKEQIIYEQYKQPDYIQWDEETFTGDAYPVYSWGVNVVEVEVDETTYEVDVKNIWSVYDVGKSLDDLVVLGQADGGTAQGVAYGYLEVMNHKEGKLQQKNMTDYIIPTAVDMAKTETRFIENPFALGPYGAKGTGELTLVGGAPAVALAIEMAINKPVTTIPVTPEVIMELMRNDNH